MNLYEEEKADMVKAGVLDRVFLALSREPNIPKVSGSHSNLSISLIDGQLFEWERDGHIIILYTQLSRLSSLQTYVQNLALKEASEIYKFLVLEKGHFYVCGDCTMAEHVYQTLKTIIQKYGGMNENQVQSYMLSLRVSLWSYILG